MISQVLRRLVRGGVIGGVLLSCILFFVRCSHTESVKENPDGLFAEAEESFQDERYLIAIEKYRDIKNRFPYSSRALDAELRIADCYYEQESYLEAASSYEIFLELHPTHPKTDYVQYRIAMSYYNQIPENAARDLSAAYKAIDEFQILLDKHSSSSYAEKAKDYIQEARKRLAEQENYVADFYFQRKHYLSASYRYAALLQDYPNLGYEEEALYRLGMSYYHIRMFSNARDTLNRLLKQFPESGNAGQARGIVEDLTKRN